HVLQLQRVDVGGDDRPLHGGRRRHHPTGALVQSPQRREVVRQPLAQVLRLADVEHSPVRIPEPVHPRVGGDLARARPVGQDVGHQPALRARPAGVSRISARKRPVWLSSTSAICSGVPVASTWPPPDPPSGPRSITQSEDLMTSRLCSMTMTVFPLSTSPFSTSSSLRTSSKCSPVVGSSST